MWPVGVGDGVIATATTQRQIVWMKDTDSGTSVEEFGVLAIVRDSAGSPSSALWYSSVAASDRFIFWTMPLWVINLALLLRRNESRTPE